MVGGDTRARSLVPPPRPTEVIIVSGPGTVLVAAGGPQTGTLHAALQMMEQVVQSGARGATIGRNIWGLQQITAAVQAFKAVIHDGKTADEALQQAGLAGGKR